MSARSAAEPTACAVCGAHLVEGARVYDTCGKKCETAAAHLRRFAADPSAKGNHRSWLAAYRFIVPEGAKGWALSDRGREIARALGITISIDEVIK